MLNRTIKAVCFALLVGMVAGFDDTWAQSAANTPAELQAAEDTLGLTRLQRYQIQENLAAGGFNPGRADGVFGRLTREAIRNWQAGLGEDATGYLTKLQARALQEGNSENMVASEKQAEDEGETVGYSDSGYMLADEGTAKSAVVTTEKQAEGEGETVAKAPADEGPTVEETVEYLNHKFFECEGIYANTYWRNYGGQHHGKSQTIINYPPASTEISGDMLIHKFVMSVAGDVERRSRQVTVRGEVLDEVRLQVDLRHIGSVELGEDEYGRRSLISLACRSGHCIEAEITENMRVVAWWGKYYENMSWIRHSSDSPYGTNPPPDPVKKVKDRHSQLQIRCLGEAGEKIQKALNHLIGKMGTVKELF